MAVLPVQRPPPGASWGLPRPPREPRQQEKTPQIAKKHQKYRKIRGFVQKVSVFARFGCVFDPKNAAKSSENAVFPTKTSYFTGSRGVVLRVFSSPPNTKPRVLRGFSSSQREKHTKNDPGEAPGDPPTGPKTRQPSPEHGSRGILYDSSHSEPYATSIGLKARFPSPVKITTPEPFPQIWGVPGPPLKSCRIRENTWFLRYFRPPERPAPREPQDVPKRPQDAPRSPKTPQDAPKRPKTRPRGQEAPKRRPEAPILAY